MRNKNSFSFASTWVHLFFCGAHVAHLFSFLCCVFVWFVRSVSYVLYGLIWPISLWIFHSWLSLRVSLTIMCIRSLCLYTPNSVLWCPLQCSFCLYLLFVGGLMSCLRYLSLFAYCGVQHILCCVFHLFVLCLVCPMLPVSMDCPYLIAPSVFCNVFCLVSLHYEYCSLILSNHEMILRTILLWWCSVHISFKLHWIYNYLCNQYLSPLTLWVRIPLRRGVLDTILCDNVCQRLVEGWLCSPGTPVFSTNKTDRHDITEILLKVVLNVINLTI